MYNLANSGLGADLVSQPPDRPEESEVAIVNKLDRGHRLWTIPEVETQREVFKEIQGYCVIGHGKRLVWLALLRFLCRDTNQKLAMQALARYGQAATSAYDLHQSYVSRNVPTAGVGVVRAVGLSSTGYEVFPDEQAPEPLEFQSGFAKQGEYPSLSRYDALIVLAGTHSELEGEKQKLESAFKDLAEVHWEFSEVRRFNQLGFEEGISQPVFFEATWTGPPASQLKYNPATNLGIVLADPHGNGEYGSFLAYVKFKLDIDRFNDYTEEIARSCRTTREVAASWFLGRHPSTSAPLAIEGKTNDSFTFDEDKSFALCPAGAHIRKMADRTRLDGWPYTQGTADGKPPDRDNALTHRIYRCGTLYDQNGEQGLLFQSFQSSLAAGFEKLFFKWAKDENSPEHGSGPDAILADRHSAPHPQGVTVKLPATKAVATVKDGEYFYFPGIPFFSRALPK